MSDITKRRRQVKDREIKPAVTHTPTPWKVCKWNQTLTISNGDEDGIAFINPHDEKIVLKDVDNANAAFIVRAVNNHEALLEALLKAKRGLVCALDATEGDIISPSLIDCIIDDISQAIAQAEEK